MLYPILFSFGFYWHSYLPALFLCSNVGSWVRLIAFILYFRFLYESCYFTFCWLPTYCFREGTGRWLPQGLTSQIRDALAFPIPIPCRTRERNPVWVVCWHWHQVLTTISPLVKHRVSWTTALLTQWCILSYSIKW